jgi:hypothetical protein
VINQTTIKTDIPPRRTLRAKGQKAHSTVASKIASSTGTAVLVLSADDITGIGAIDDIAIPFAGTIVAVAAVYDAFVTTNSSNNEVSTPVMISLEHTKGK